ncbi:MAG: thermonuclease family protein [Desulfococcaceae bacterium]
MRRNRLADTDDLETLSAKLIRQAEAKERSRHTTDAQRLRILGAAARMMLKVEERLVQKYGAPLINQGRMERAADGDTLYIRRPDEVLLRVRLYGVDAPEISQPFGPQARDFLARWKYRKLGWETVRSDRWGRIVAIVYGPEDGPSINGRLVEAGLAWVSTDFCGREICRRWERMMKIAMEERRGLWVQESPESPWDYRGGMADD